MADAEAARLRAALQPFADLAADLDDQVEATPSLAAEALVAVPWRLLRAAQDAIEGRGITP